MQNTVTMFDVLSSGSLTQQQYTKMLVQKMSFILGLADTLAEKLGGSVVEEAAEGDSIPTLAFVPGTTQPDAADAPRHGANTDAVISLLNEANYLQALLTEVLADNGTVDIFVDSAVIDSLI